MRLPRLAAAGCLILLIESGCASVREIEVPLAETTLMVTRSGDVVNLQWASQNSLDYIVWYTDQRGARSTWKALPGSERIRGTGAPIAIRDQPPRGQNRYYRVQAIPAAAGQH